MPTQVENAKLPKVFHVNWFRRDAPQGSFLWPGFGENARVLEWIVERVDATGDEGAVETPIGYVPTKEALNTAGLDISDEVVSQLLEVDPAEWLDEARRHSDFFDTLGPRVPEAMYRQAELLAEKATAAIAKKSK